MHFTCQQYQEKAIYMMTDVNSFFKGNNNTNTYYTYYYIYYIIVFSFKNSSSWR